MAGPSNAAVLVKVNALIDKAISTHSEEEARTCALTAIKMLRQYGLRVDGDKPSLTDDPVFTREVISATKRATAIFQQKLRDAIERATKAETRALVAEARVNNMAKEKAHLEEAEHIKDVAGRWMRSRFTSPCRRCGIYQATGEKVWWLGARKGILCADCWWKKTYQRAI
jgi:hypothetical protein